MRTVVDLVGKRVGRLTVLKQMKIDKIKMCECVCECGNIVIASVNLLWQGNKKSCGCLYKETRKTSAVSHGMSYSPEYRVWNGMKTRCTSVSHKAFKDYGGRGITYDPSWENFENFLKDMGERPSDRHTIERLDVDGNYCKENCIWIDDRSEQGYNRGIVSNNTSGRTGVHFSLDKNKWVASIGFNRKVIYLGAYTTFEEAVSAREVAEIEYYGYNKK